MRSTPAIRIIAIILVFAALAVAREVFIPIALALCFHALLSPVVRGLERLRLPTPAGAAIVVLGGLALVVVGAWALSGPVKTWVDKAPRSIAAARAKIRSIGPPLSNMSEAAQGTKAEAATQASPPSGPAVPSLFAQLLGRATALIAGFIEVLLLLFLMLAAGNMLFRKLMKVVPGPDDKRTASDIVHETESIVSRYLLVTASINVGQSVAVGLAMWAIGMPDPLIWGLLTFTLEFIPYVGGMIMVGLLLISGFTVFDSVGQVLLGPAIYLVISTLQNNVVSPFAYGNRLKLSPLAVMICVLFWWFIWGIPGAFLAIPIAATLKVLGDQVPRLAPLGELLGE